jgi:hypothetical protein
MKSSNKATVPQRKQKLIYACAVNNQTLHVGKKFMKIRTFDFR